MVDTRRIDAFGSWVHYRQHITPIWDALPDEVRGTFHDRRVPPGSDPVMVASRADLGRVKNRPVVFVEHGAGQTYIDNRTPGGYAGGPDRGKVSLFLNPTERVHDLNRQAYPQARHALVGSARLEKLRRLERLEHRPAFSFHWDCRVTQESRSAWPHYQTLPEVVDMSTVLGHGHPRAWSTLSRWWETVGAEPVRSFDEIVQRASVYVCDNSSTIYEAAALDIPVVLLNAPWYRKDVHHGLRFWEELPGPMIDRPDKLPRAIEEAGEWYPDRAATTERVYGQIEGSIGRAVEAVLAMCRSPQRPGAQ